MVPFVVKYKCILLMRRLIYDADREILGLGACRTYDDPGAAMLNRSIYSIILAK